MDTALTLEKSLPDGDYHWRVRAIRANGDAGRWSRALVLEALARAPGAATVAVG